MSTKAGIICNNVIVTSFYSLLKGRARRHRNACISLQHMESETGKEVLT